MPGTAICIIYYKMRNKIKLLKKFKTNLMSINIKKLIEKFKKIG